MDKTFLVNCPLHKITKVKYNYMNSQLDATIIILIIISIT